MHSTIKFLKTLSNYMSVMLVFLIIDIILTVIGAVVSAIVTGMWTLLLIGLSVIIPIIIASVMSDVIASIEGSITEHHNLDDKINELTNEVNHLREQIAANKKAIDTNEKEITAVVEKTNNKEKIEKIEQPANEPKDKTTLKPDEVSVKDKTIVLNGKLHEISKVTDLSVLGSELHFVVDETKYIVVFDYFSEASKMYDNIDSRSSK